MFRGSDCAYNGRNMQGRNYMGHMPVLTSHSYAGLPRRNAFTCWFQRPQALEQTMPSHEPKTTRKKTWMWPRTRFTSQFVAISRRLFLIQKTIFIDLTKVVTPAEWALCMRWLHGLVSDAPAVLRRHQGRPLSTHAPPTAKLFCAHISCCSIGFERLLYLGSHFL